MKLWRESPVVVIRVIQETFVNVAAVIPGVVIHKMIVSGVDVHLNRNPELFAYSADDAIFFYFFKRWGSCAEKQNSINIYSPVG